jgi:hypothetical protein
LTASAINWRIAGSNPARGDKCQIFLDDLPRWVYSLGVPAMNQFHRIEIERRSMTLPGKFAIAEFREVSES